MKTRKMLLIVLAATALLTGCAGAPAGSTDPIGATGAAPTAAAQTAAPGALDLTRLSSTMVYSEVFNMLADPASYVGRTVRMNGTATCITNPQNGKQYYACLIADATGCCAQGLEYVLPDGEVYPEAGTDITISGTFALYEENGYQSFHLVDAAIL